MPEGIGHIFDAADLAKLVGASVEFLPEQGDVVQRSGLHEIPPEFQSILDGDGWH
jgi:hypothetical protein